MNFSRIFVTGGSGFIGTNLIDDLFKDKDISILNVDLVRPKVDSHLCFWREADIRDGTKIGELLREFKPDAVIHLAARTDLNGQVLADYSSNTDGNSILVKALESINFSGTAIFASSMYVCQPGYKPTSDTDFQPHTIYGESKVIGEKLIRAANPQYPWVIVRPTSIWGPWFGIPYADFFRMVLTKKYVNISGSTTVKTYGYVGNTVAQIKSILQNSRMLTSKVVYLGDWPPYIINDWADEIAEFVPYRVPRVPKLFLKGAAMIGDIAKFAGIRFPMTSFRLSNLTTDNVHDLGTLKDLMGASLPYTRQEGNALTVKWLRTVHSSL